MRDSSVGIWFNFGDTSSAWTDGPNAGPIFYSENFGPGKDLSYSGALTANKTENKSLGGNLTWEAPGNVTVILDAHHSTAESKPTNKYGTSTSIGNAIFGVQSQTVNFENDLPVLSYQMYPGIDPLDRSLITPTGNSFRNAYFRDEINQVQLTGHYDHDGDILESIDAGFSYVDNKVRSAYGFIQNDTWGGIGPASDIPDDLFSLVTLPDKFDGVEGADAGIIPSFYVFDFAHMADLLEDLYGVCARRRPAWQNRAPACRLHRRPAHPREDHLAVHPVQPGVRPVLDAHPRHRRRALRPDRDRFRGACAGAVGTRWVSANEFGVIYSGDSDFTRFRANMRTGCPRSTSTFRRSTM